MKGKTTKRVLAWIMSLCMIFGIIPASPYEYKAQAVQGEEKSLYTYDFGGLVSANQVLVTAATATVNTPLYATADAKAPFDTAQEIAALKPNSDKWYLSDAGVTLNNSSIATRVKVLVTATGFNMALRSTSLTQIDVKINVEQAGTYDISTDIQHTVPSTASAAKVEFVGEGISYTTHEAENGSVDIASATLEAKEYTVRYSLQGRMGATGSSSDASLIVRSLTLAKKAEVVPTAYDFSGKVTGATETTILYRQNVSSDYPAIDRSDICHTLTFANATSKGSLPWGYKKMGADKERRNYCGMDVNSLLVKTHQGRGSNIALVIKPAESGYYELTPEYKLSLSSAGATNTKFHGARIELLSEDETSSLLKFSKTAAVSSFTAESMGIAYLDKDKEYVLKMDISAGDGASGDNTFYVKSLALTPKLPVIVTASAASIPAQAGEEKTFTISANYGEDELDLSAEGVEVKCEVTSGAAETSYAQGTVTVKPSKNGVNTVKVSVSYEGMTGSCQVVLYSLPDDDKAEKYSYDFVKSKPDGYSEQAFLQDMPELASFANSLIKGSAPWMYHSGGEKVNGNNIWSYDIPSNYAFTIRQRGGAEPPRRLRIFLPSDGLYTATVNTYNWEKSTKTDFSLIPCDENGVEQGDEIYIGAADGYLPSGSATAQLYVGKAELKRGYYILSMAQHRLDATLQYARLNKFELSRVHADISYEVPAPVAIGDSVEMPFTATVSGKAAACTEISAAANDNFTVALNGEKNALVFTGVKAGTSSAAVTFKFGDTEQTVNIPLSVYDSDKLGNTSYTYDFTKNHAVNSFYNVNSFNMTTAGADEEINSVRPSAPWKFESSVDNPTFKHDAEHSYGYLLYATKGTSFRIRVPENGRYNLYNRVRKSTNAGALSISIQNAKGEGKYANKTHLNTVDIYAEADSAVYKEPVLYGTVDLIAGDYIITYENEKTSSAGDVKTPVSGIILESVPAALDLDVALSKPEKMLVGETYKLPILITLAGIIRVDASKYTAEITSNTNPDVADLSVKREQNGEYYLEVIGKIDHETRVAITVEGEGRSITHSALISVNSERMLYDDVVYDWMKTNTYTGTNINISEFTDFQTSIDAGSAPWKFLANNSSGTFIYTNAGYGFFMKDRGERKLVIYVPETNTYVPEVVVDLWTEGTTCIYSLTPSDEDGNVTGNEFELGMINSAGPSGSEFVTVAMDKVYVKKGYYVLTMTAGDAKYISNSFTLRNQAVLLNTESPAPVAIGETLEIPVNASLLGEESTASFDRITFDAADTSIASFEGGADGKTMKIRGLKAGTTTVAVRVGIGDLSARRILSVTVYDADKTTDTAEYRYSFGKASTNQAMSEILSFNMTTAGADGEINPSRKTAPWRYEGSADAPTFIVYTPEGYGAFLSKTAGTSVKIRVPENGRFSFVSENWFQNEGGKLSVYLQRADGTGEYANKTLLGTIDTYTEKKQPEYLRRTKLGEVNLKAGDYIVTYVNEGDGRTAVGGIYLMSPKAQENFSIAPQTSAVATVGKVVRIPLNYTSALGTLPGDAGLSFNVTHSESGYADATVVIEGANAYLDIEGIAVGEMRLDIIASASGNTVADASVAISVIEEIAGVAGDLHYDFMKNNPGKDKVLDIITFENFDNSIAAGSAPWKFGNVNGGAFRYNGYETYAIYMQGQGSYSLVLQVPASGSYDIVAQMYDYSHSTKAYTSITPCDKNGGPLGAAIDLGIIETPTTLGSRVDVPLGTQYLEAGYYLWTMTFKDAKCPYVDDTGKTYAARAVIDGIKLDYQELMISGNLTNNTYVLMGNEKRIPLNATLLGEDTDWAQDASFTVNMSNRTQLDKDGNDITAEEPYANARVEKSADGKTADLVITGVAEGSTDIEVSVIMGGRQAKMSGTAISSKSGKVLGEISLSDDYIILDAGKVRTIGVTPYCIDGSVATGTKVYFESGNQAVVRVNNAGELTAAGEGVTTVTVYVEKDGVIQNATVTVRVNDQTPIESIKLNPVKPMLPGASTELSVSGVRESGLNADIDKSLVTYEFVENKDQAFKLEGNTLTALGEGRAVICAKLGEISSENLEVTASAAAAVSSIELDFRQNQTGAPTDAVFMTHGWQIDRSATAKETLAQRENLVYKAGVGIAAKITGTDATRASDMSVTFKAANDGEYAFDMFGGRFADGALAYIYVDEVFMGSYDFSGDNQTAGDTAELNSIYLTAGEHKITFRRVSGGEYIYPGVVSINLLDSTPSLEKLELRASRTTLSVGEKSTLNINAILSNGRSYSFGPKFDGSADAVNYIDIALSGVTSAIAVDGNTVTAEKTGTVKISVTAKLGDVSFSKSVSITVDDAVIESLDAELEEKNLYVGASTQIIAKSTLSNGREISDSDVTITAEVENPAVAEFKDGEILALSAGTTEITIFATLDGNTVEDTVTLEVKDHGATKLVLSADTTVMSPSTDGSQIHISANMSSGGSVAVDAASATYENQNDGVITVDENGWVTPVAIGNSIVTVKVNVGGVELEGVLSFKITDGKTQGSYYTPEKVAAARRNIEKYDWARKSRNSAIRKGDFFVDKINFLYNHMTSNELPRSSTVQLRYDPLTNTCLYCGKDLTAEHGKRPWVIDVFNSPWKIQCPECRRKFPTNDFGSFYDLGIVKVGEEELYGVEAGSWSYEKSHYEHFNLFMAEYAAAGVADYNEYSTMGERGERIPGVGYLKNTGAPEMEGVEYTAYDLPEFETGEIVPKTVTTNLYNWGADDGYGYNSGIGWVQRHPYYKSGEAPVQYYRQWSFIAFYNHYGLWNSYNDNNSGVMYGAITALRDAYLYTGDKKYGRAGAILVDRFADVYPDFHEDWQIWDKGGYYQGQDYYITYSNSDSTRPKGKQLGSIWQHGLSRYYTLGYDAFYDVYEDPTVVDYLNKKSIEWNLEDKSTPNAIRQHIEDDLLRENFRSICNGNIHGNFGMQQSLAAYTGVVLDTQPESREMIDWMYRSGIGTHGDDNITGGNVLVTLINSVRRDGHGNEGSPNYNSLWNNAIETIAEALDGYDGYPEMDMYKNPKFINMLKSFLPIIMTRRTTVQNGDSGATADTNIMAPSTSRLVRMFQKTGMAEFAQFAYFLNGNKVDGLYTSIFDEDPVAAQQEIQKAIDTYGEYDFDKSVQLGGYGFTALRGGSLYSDKDTQRDFWMYYGKASGHGQPDTLNLGIHAYGLDMAPEMGYPEIMGGEVSDNWGYTSINHNLVVVNTAKQSRIATNADPKHFDDAGRVKIMDVDASDTAVYLKAGTSIYRRTVVMIEATDEVSYGIDFFRVKGGNDHLYTFHSQSDEIYETEGLNLGSTQTMGSYAGVDIPYRAPEHETGFTYFKNIRRDTNLESNEFAVDFKVKDFRKTLKDSQGLHLRMTMLNDFKLTEVSLQQGEPPRVAGNPKMLEFVFARRKGTNLDSLFTTVFEPYKHNRYIKDMEQVDVELLSGVESDADTVKAVKVTLEDGRVDYVVYATNNKVLYRIDNKFDFRGFVGVYSLSDGKVVYSYINDGDIIGDTTTKAAYTGKVSDFTRELSIENSITVELDSAADAKELEGRFIYIENDGSENAAYPIVGVKSINGRTAVLDVGGETFIRACRDSTNLDAGYIYNIEEGQSFSIPLSDVYESSPVFTPVEDRRAAAGSKISFKVSATSPVDKDITYEAVSMPRGASFDENTQTISWTPDEKQLGEHHVEIHANDGSLTTSIHINVEVYRSAGIVGSGSGNESDENQGTGSDSSDTTPSGGDAPSGGNTPPSGNDGSGSGGGGGGGSGSAGGSGNESGDQKPDDSGNTDAGDDTPATPGEKFVDLGNHTWAKDAIYALVDSGVVNGTSENTYSPAKNIKRADFAIMLVRAFGITEGQGEHFADVDASKYYAKELLLAKANGIVGGIGDNKFNPEGEITRQDMMLMLYRALEAQGKKLPDADESVLADFADAAEIADYAKSAVASVVKAGIITGSNGRINPLSRATRAEIAVMLSRILVK